MNTHNKNTWGVLKAVFVVAAMTLLVPTLSFAQESAEAAFKRSLQESIDQPIDGRKFVAFGAIVVGLIIVAAVIARWRNRPGTPRGPRALNSTAKLLKEVFKNTNLRPAEVKQLRILCEQQNIASPLVMLLCPSMLGKAVRENQKRIDRGILSGLAKKISRR